MTGRGAAGGGVRSGMPHTTPGARPASAVSTAAGGDDAACSVPFAATGTGRLAVCGGMARVTTGGRPQYVAARGVGLVRVDHRR